MSDKVEVRCDNCKSLERAEAKFCSSCGQPLDILAGVTGKAETIGPKVVTDERRSRSRLKHYLIGAAVILFLALATANESLPEDEADKLLERVDAQIERLGDLWAEEQDIFPLLYEDYAEMSRHSKAISFKFRLMRNELRLAEKRLNKIAKLGVSEDYEKYAVLLLAVIDEVERLVEDGQELERYVKTLSGPMQKFELGLEKWDQGDDQTNQAVSLLNKSQYTQVKEAANRAGQSFDEALKLFQEAADGDQTLGLEAGVALVKKCKERANVEVASAERGLAGNTYAYNQLVDQSNRMRAEQEDLWKKVQECESRFEARVDNYVDRMEAHAKKLNKLGDKADEFRREALEI